ncbi:MAG: glycosyltransferase [Myxococcales bacterium]|nr:glycosyltransferase [Myxococcales bacterium]
MARFVFVVPPLTGHVNPTLGVAAALQERGHTVAWVGHPQQVQPLLPADATLWPLPQDGDAHAFAQSRERGAELKGLASIKFFVEEFQIPLARQMAPGVRAAIEQLQPDVLVVDQQALAGAVLARQLRIPWATSATTTAEIVKPWAAFPQVARWRQAQLAELQETLGGPVVAEPSVSERLVLVYSTRALVGDHPVDEQVAFVGPMTRGDRPHVPFPWDALMDRPRVLVSLGTVSARRGPRFYQVVAEALAGEPVQGILVAPESLIPPLPDNILRRDFVPQLQLLPHVQAVVSHGGHNTVCETLAHGLPLVVTPIRDDQPVVAQQVADAGAGIRLPFGRLRAPRLRQAIREVLTDPEYRRSAERIQSSFTASKGAPGAATLLEQLLPGSREPSIA